MKKIERKYFKEYFVYGEEDGEIAKAYDITYDNGKIVDCEMVDYCVIKNDYNFKYEDFFGLTPTDEEYYSGDEITEEEYNKLYENNLNHTV